MVSGRKSWLVCGFRANNGQDGECSGISGWEHARDQKSGLEVPGHSQVPGHGGWHLGKEARLQWDI